MSCIRPCVPILFSLAFLFWFVSEDARASSISVDFAPIPVVPTQDQCRNNLVADLATVSGVFASAEATRRASHPDGTTDGLKLQNENLREQQRLLDVAYQRQSECLRLALANADQQAQSQSLAGKLTSGMTEALKTGMGGMPKSVSSNLMTSGQFKGDIPLVTGLASQAFTRYRDYSSVLLRVEFTSDLAKVIANGGFPSGDLAERLSKNSEYAQNLVGAGLPPWSKMFTSMALSGIMAINGDALSQLNSAIQQFDASGNMEALSRDIKSLEQSYGSNLSGSIGGIDNGALQALRALDQAVAQMAALANETATLRAAEQKAEENRRIAAASLAAQTAAVAQEHRRIAAARARESPLPPPQGGQSQGGQSQGGQSHGVSLSDSDLGYPNGCRNRWNYDNCAIRERGCTGGADSDRGNRLACQSVCYDLCDVPPP